MFKHAILGVDRIETIGLIGLILLVVVFTAIIIWAATIDKRTISHLSELPLHDEKPTDLIEGKSHG